MASVRSRSSGSPSALSKAAPASVNVVNETTSPATMANGRQRLGARRAAGEEDREHRAARTARSP